MQLIARILAWFRRLPEPEGPPITLAQWYESGQQLTEREEHLLNVQERRAKETPNLLGPWA